MSHSNHNFTTRLKSARRAVIKYRQLEFFLFGVIFDLFTLKRIDQRLTIWQQGIFLLLIFLLMLYKIYYESKPNLAVPESSVSNPPRFPLKSDAIDSPDQIIPSPQGRLQTRAAGAVSPSQSVGSNQPEPLPLRARANNLHKAAPEMTLAFLFGSLLSAFTIFYFKSSSGLYSALFISGLCILLVFIELPTFKATKWPFKMGLLSLCLISYLGYLIPTLLGQLGIISFTLSVATCLGLLGGFLYLIHKYLHNLNYTTLKSALWWSGASVLVYVLLYLTNIIPPVPLSLKYIAIFHEIKKDSSNRIIGYHENKPWNFWDNGDQSFIAQPGDKIYCFTSIFSPTGFKTQVFFRWDKKNKNGQWVKQDRIPIELKGGRDEGFRGFVAKSNYQPGDWQITVETADGKEIGRISMRLDLGEQKSRQLAPQIL